MNRYDLRVAWIGGEVIDISSAVSDDVQITNGRQDLSTPIGQTYASITFLKSRLFQIFSDEGFARDALTFGSKLTIEVRTEGAVTSYEPLFTGRVTDMTSNAYEITFSLVDLLIYELNGAAEATMYGFSEPLTTHFSQYITSLIGVGSVDIEITSANDAYIDTETVNVTNRLQAFENIVGQVPSAWIYINTNNEILTLTQRPPNITQTPIVIYSNDVLRNYSIDRSIDDVSNSVQIIYPLGTYAKTNATSVAAIGERFTSITTQLTDYPDVLAFAFWYLGAHAPAGYPLVNFRTSAELLSLTAEQIATQLQPNALLDLSNITSDGFDEYAYIEQVRHTISRAQWVIDVTISNSDYSELTQTWSQVAPTTLWSDVLNDANNFTTWDDLLYTSL